MSLTEISRPVFAIGVPRSGTSIFFDAFTRHRDLAFLTRYDERLPGVPWVDLICRLFDNRLFGARGVKDQYRERSFLNKLLPKAAECYRIWNDAAGLDFGRSYLLGRSAEPAARRRLRRAMGLRRAIQGKERFATKMTGPGRITYLRSVFPDACFIHLIRDGRAVVHSLMRVDWWERGGGRQRPWWEGGLGEEELELWRAHDGDPGVLAAIQWRKIIDTTRREAEELAVDRYVEVRYEEFVEAPHDVLSRLYGLTGLADSPRAHAWLGEHRLDPAMNRKYQRDWSPETVATVTRALEPTLSELGYR